MGVFFTSPQPVAPAIQAELEETLMMDPNRLPAEPHIIAAARAHELAKKTAPKFHPWNFVGALVISAALLVTAICIDTSHAEIAKTLMTSFTSFSGIVLGLLGGEAQKSAS
jgi:hypothetical protein